MLSCFKLTVVVFLLVIRLMRHGCFLNVNVWALQMEWDLSRKFVGSNELNLGFLVGFFT